jgi:ubiquinone/menaquinone biosynthesis C-methylase UbiE
MSTFPDHFSKQSSTYAKSRPRYPRELFEWLSNQCAHHRRAWDCATGNGQAALSLTEHFDQVIATDASPNQIRNAFPHPRITYQVATAERSGLADESADLITVGTALHWFNQQAFFAEANRVLTPDGVLAVWSYAGTRGSPVLNAVLDEFAFQTLLEYWSEGAKRNWIGRYKDVLLPFEPIVAPQFFCREEWTFEQLIDYLNSWSAVQTYKDVRGVNPLDQVEPAIRRAWGHSPRQWLTWELWLKASRKAQVKP